MSLTFIFEIYLVSGCNIFDSTWWRSNGVHIRQISLHSVCVFSITDASIYVIYTHTFYQVIRGGDGKAGLAIRHPNGQLVKAYEWLPSSDYSEPSSTGGYYAICLDNQFSRFASKLVNIYITVIKYDQWTKYAQEIEGLQLNMQNFTVS